MSNGFRIYKTNQKIEIKVDDISIFISPLSYHQKLDLQDLMLKASQGDMNAAMSAIVKALKVSLKDIKGVVQDDEGTEYKLEFIDGEVSDDCVNDLLNMPCSNKISTICTSLLAGVPDKILGADGQPLEGVSIVKQKAVSKPKK
jgi:hypothetical protein